MRNRTENWTTCYIKPNRRESNSKMCYNNNTMHTFIGNKSKIAQIIVNKNILSTLKFNQHNLIKKGPLKGAQDEARSLTYSALTRNTHKS